MGDFAIHLNQATKTCERPSIFDLVAQESLMSTLRPAFEFTIRTLAERFPEKLSHLLGYTDEVFYGLTALIERHFIWTKNASFAEHFYGLRRVALTSFMNGINNSSTELTFNKKVASLLSLTLVPYLLSKIQKRFAAIKEEMNLNETLPRSNVGKLNDLLYKLYPYIHFILEGSKLATMISYVLRLVSYNSISNSIIGVTLAYSNFSGNTVNESEAISQYNGQSSFFKFLSRLIGVFSYAFSVSIEYALPTIAFFLRFLEWWYSSSNSPKDHINSMPIPPPPIDSQLPSHGFKLPAHPSQCPLCHNNHKNPTALSITGYVFCYTCIFKFVEEHGYCPVTRIQCTVDDLVRLYI